MSASLITSGNSFLLYLSVSLQNPLPLLIRLSWCSSSWILLDWDKKNTVIRISALYSATPQFSKLSLNDVIWNCPVLWRCAFQDSYPWWSSWNKWRFPSSNESGNSPDCSCWLYRNWMCSPSNSKHLWWSPVCWMTAIWLCSSWSVAQFHPGIWLCFLAWILCLGF